MQPDLQHLTQQGVHAIHRITTHHASGFLQALRSGRHHMGDRVDASVNRILIAARGWHRFMFLENTTDSNPAADIRPPKTGQYLPDGLSGEEVTRLLATPAADMAQGLRDRALMELVYATRARIPAA